MKKPDRKALEGRVYRLFEHLIHEIDQQAIRRDVNALRQKYPDAPREKLAARLIRKASVSTAIIGAGAGAPGGSIGILAMAPDIFNLVRQQSKLVLSIAFLYEQEPDVEERLKEVIATLAVATGTTAGRQGVRYLVVKGLEGRTAKVVLEKIAGKFISRKAAAIAPVVGSVAGASFNYLAVQGVGKVAIDYYSRLLEEKERTKRGATASKEPKAAGKKRSAGKATRKGSKPRSSKSGAKRPSGTARSTTKKRSTSKKSSGRGRKTATKSSSSSKKKTASSNRGE